MFHKRGDKRLDSSGKHISFCQRRRRRSMAQMNGRRQISTSRVDIDAIDEASNYKREGRR